MIKKFPNGMSTSKLLTKGKEDLTLHQTKDGWGIWEENNHKFPMVSLDKNDLNDIDKVTYFIKNLAEKMYAMGRDDRSAEIKRALEVLSGD